MDSLARDRPPGLPPRAITETNEGGGESSSNFVESHPPEHFQNSTHSFTHNGDDHRDRVVARSQDTEVDMLGEGGEENEKANATVWEEEITDSGIGIGIGGIEKMRGWETSEQRTARELEEAREEYHYQLALRSKTSSQAVPSNSQAASRSTNPNSKPHDIVYVYRFEIPSTALTRWLIGSGGVLCRRVRIVAKVDVLYLDSALAHRLPLLVRSKPVGLLQGTVSQIQHALNFIKENLQGCEYQWRSQVVLNTNTVNFFEFLNYKPERLLQLTEANDLNNLHKARVAKPAPFSPISRPPNRPFAVHQNRFASTSQAPRYQYQSAHSRHHSGTNSTKRSRPRSAFSQAEALSPQVKRRRPSNTSTPSQDMKPPLSESTPQVQSPPRLEMDLGGTSCESDQPEITALSVDIPLAAVSAFFGPMSSLPHLELVTGTKLKLECETTTARIVAVSGMDKGGNQKKIDRLRVGIEETVEAVLKGTHNTSQNQDQDRAHPREGPHSKTPAPTTYPSPISVRQHLPPDSSIHTETEDNPQQKEGRDSEDVHLNSKPLDDSSNYVPHSPNNTEGRSRSTTLSEEEAFRRYRTQEIDREFAQGRKLSLSRDREERRTGRSRSPPSRCDDYRRERRIARGEEVNLSCSPVVEMKVREWLTDQTDSKQTHSRAHSRPSQPRQLSPLRPSASPTRSPSTSFPHPFQRARPYVSRFVSKQSHPSRERARLRLSASSPPPPLLQPLEDDRYAQFPPRPRSSSRLPSVSIRSRSPPRLQDSGASQISPPIHLTITEEERRILQRKEEEHLFEQKMRGEGRWRFEGPNDPTERYRWARGGDWSKLRVVEDERRFGNRVENQRSFQEEIRRRREQEDREREYDW
ncbi:hypothetical protein JCM3765_004685 [Sporobolomyces pararoseus]